MDLFDYFTHARPLGDYEMEDDGDVDEEREEYERLGVSFDPDDVIDLDDDDV